MEFFPRRCFFRAIPPKAGLPGHKLGLEQKVDSKSEGGQAKTTMPNERVSCQSQATSRKSQA